jgi:hypothetical protein
VEPEPNSTDTTTSARDAGRRRWIVGGAVALVLIAVVGFAVFRPDKLVVDKRVDEQLSSDVAAVVGEAPTTAPPTTAPPSSVTDGGAAQVPAAPGTTAPAIVELGRGTFVGQSGHRVAGTAVVVDRPEGLLLVLPELDAENGPDLQLYLSPESGGSIDGGVYLEPLKGNQGTQTYELPAGIDLATLDNVVIWCERFSVPFGTASLSA